MNRVLARWFCGVVAATSVVDVRAADPPRPLVPSPAKMEVQAKAISPASLLMPEDLFRDDPTAVPAGERSAHVQVAIVRVPAGFAETAGLVSDPKTSSRVWPLSAREAKLFSALLLADKRCEVQTVPRMRLTHEQPGLFRVGQDCPVIGSMAFSKENGENVLKAKVTYHLSGFELRMTPKIAADGRSMTLKGAIQYTKVAGKQVVLPTKKPDGDVVQATWTVANAIVLGNGETATASSTQSIEVDLQLSHGGTVVIGGFLDAESDDKREELLAIVQAAVGTTPKK